MSSTRESQQVLWNSPIWLLGLLGIAGLVMAWGYYDGLDLMVYRWGSSEEYGYGYMIPVLTAFFIWQKKNELAEVEFSGSWAGVLILLTGGLLLVVGELSSLYIIIQYAFLIALAGLALSFTGWRAFRLIAVPLAILIFMIPLPGFIYLNLSSELQLISSQLGVAVIRLFGISVHLEGNVIDLGTYKLQVVEACSGLRYLFPLTSLAFIAAYLFRGALWKKAVIFLSSIPITVLMNSFRIGVIGVLVEHGGPGQAEGFLHDFEGWVVFMGCMGVLILEMWILARIGKNKLSLAEAFAIDWPEARPQEPARRRPLPRPFLAALPIVIGIALVPHFLSERTEHVPTRMSFDSFPMEVEEWRGTRSTIESIVIDVLKFDDYIKADYLDPSGQSVNLYVAYYDSQSKGESAHSPRTCIPGGGWQISSHDVVPVALQEGLSMPVNRLVIAMGDYKQLVYYWFDGRDRVITNEYMVKWYLFWDSLTRNRSDGALVRLTTTIPPTEDVAAAEQRLISFLQQVNPKLGAYIPE